MQVVIISPIVLWVMVFSEIIVGKNFIAVQLRGLFIVLPYPENSLACSTMKFPTT